MMESCGICFPLRRGDETLDIETEYVAPDLLPERTALQQEIDKQWDNDAPVEEAVFDYALLHQGLIRAIISRIGRNAGVSATYWKGGVCVYEKKTRSHALIEQHMTDDSAGSIRVATQGGQAADLLRKMVELVTQVQQQHGLTPRSAPDVEREAPRAEREKDESESKRPSTEFGAKPRATQSYYVSFACDDPAPDGKKREAVVDALCARARDRGVTVLRDKDVLKTGDSISQFMIEIGEGDRIFVILSDKYMKSHYCMFELFEIWRTSRQDKAAFLRRCRFLNLGDADILTLKGRLDYAIHWKSERDLIDAALKQHGPSVIGESDFARYKLMQHFVNHVGDVLAAIADIVQARTLEDLERDGFDDPPDAGKA